MIRVIVGATGSRPVCWFPSLSKEGQGGFWSNDFKIPPKSPFRKGGLLEDSPQYSSKRGFQ